MSKEHDCDNLFCYDCKKPINCEGEELVNAVFLSYKDGGDEYKVIKCNDCYEKNPSLTNYKQCEVYSRIVGYIRPINQWNEGKRAEYEERKTYKIEEI